MKSSRGLGPVPGKLSFLHRMNQSSPAVRLTPLKRAGLLVCLAAVCLGLALHHHGVLWTFLKNRGTLPSGPPAAMRALASATGGSSVGTFTVIDVPQAGTGQIEGTVAVAINDAGTIAGIYMNPATVFHGFVRDAGGNVTPFDAPNGGTGALEGTLALSINSAGEIAGTYIDSNIVSHGFIRSTAGKITPFDAPGAGTAKNRGTAAISIDDDGDVVGFYSTGSYNTASTYHGFLRSAKGEFTNIDAPNAGSGQDPDNGRKQGTQAYAMNAAGEISGAYVDSNQARHGFLRTSTGYEEFDPPGADSGAGGQHQGMNGTLATAIDAAGDTAGAYTDSSGVRHGFIRTFGGTFTTFSAPGASGNAGFLEGTLPFSLSPEGAYLSGFYSDSSGVAHGFVRADGNVTSYDAPKAGGAGSSMFPGTAGLGVNDAGEIAGLYVDANGAFHGFLLTPSAATPAATPKLNPVAGTYPAPLPVRITDSTTGAAIHYTLNGSAPTSTSTLYSAPITLTRSATVKAIAVASGHTNSAVATSAYTLEPLAATPVFTPIAGNYRTAQTVKIADATTGAAIYYTTNGSAPSNKSTRYTTAIKVGASETLKAIAEASGYLNSKIATGAYKIGLPAAVAPKFSIPGATYTSVQTVAITDATAGASIYYTANGSVPTTTSTKYTKPITVKTTETLRAIAASSTHSNSPVTSATYTIHLPAAAP